MIDKSYFHDFPELKTERLLLRKFSLSDAGEILRIRSNDKIMRYMDSKIHTDVKDAEDFIADNLKTYEKGKGIFWALVENGTGELVGDFSFWNIDQRHCRAQIGYTLKPEFWGKGYMKEAMIAVFDFAFKRLKLHSLEANINPENEKSRNILVKMGFLKEAYFRENYFYNGVFLDSEIYCLLEKDLISNH